MTTLSGKTTAGLPAWDVYVVNNALRSTIDYQVEPSATNVFFYSGTNDIPSGGLPSKQSPGNPIAQLVPGDTFKILSTVLVSRGRLKFANIMAGTTRGYIKYNAIKKPTGASDQVERDTLAATEIYLNKLQEISAIGNGTNSAGVALEIPGVGLKMVNKIEKVSNRIHGREAKSDFVLKNNMGRGVAFISHKKTGGAAAFGQYGGISESQAGSIQDAAELYNDPETQSYLNRLWVLYNDRATQTIPNNPFSSARLNRAVYRWIGAGTLVAKSVYGPSYGGERGPDNVDILGQGNFIFKPLLTDDNDIYFQLEFSDAMHINGDLGVFTERTSGYAACFITTYRAGRNTETPGGTVPSTRTAIYPRRYRQSAIDIDTLS